MRELIDVTLLKTGEKYLLEPCCDQCEFNVSVKEIESFSGRVHIAYCSKCGNYLKATKVKKDNITNKKSTGVPASALCYFRDGNKWCCVFGDFINLQESPAGFGDTQAEAFNNLSQQWEEIKGGDNE